MSTSFELAVDGSVNSSTLRPKHLECARVSGNVSSSASFAPVTDISVNSSWINGQSLFAFGPLGTCCLPALHPL